MSAGDVCRCLTPEEWRDGLCGYCGRPERVLYPAREAALPEPTLHGQVALSVQSRQRIILAHLRGIGDLLAGSSMVVSDDVLRALAGLDVTRDEVRLTVTLRGQPRPQLAAPLLPPEFVPEGEG